MGYEVVIPAYKPDGRLLQIIDRLKAQEIKPDRITVMLTVESDEEIGQLWDRLPDSVMLVPVRAEDFSHGGTRQLAMDSATSEYVLFMTQDAVPVDKKLTVKLIEALSDDSSCMAYARQLPRKSADAIERFTRHFNYPSKSHTQSPEDLKTKGIKAIFCSDSCCMYKKSVHDSLGGFDRTTQFNEDSIFAYKALNSGYSVEYCAEARVRHSHNLTLKQQFERNRAIAKSQKEHPEVYANIVSEKEGIKYVITGIRYFLRKKELINAFMLTVTAGVRYAGFFTGKHFD